jgi:hypothetical protein
MQQHNHVLLSRLNCATTHATMFNVLRSSSCSVLSELLGVSNYMIINMLSTCVHLKASLFQLQIATNFHV